MEPIITSTKPTLESTKVTPANDSKISIRKIFSKIKSGNWTGPSTKKLIISALIIHTVAIAIFVIIAFATGGLSVAALAAGLAAIKASSALIGSIATIAVVVDLLIIGLIFKDQKIKKQKNNELENAKTKTTNQKNVKENVRAKTTKHKNIQRNVRTSESDKIKKGALNLFRNFKEIHKRALSHENQELIKFLKKNPNSFEEICNELNGREKDGAELFRAYYMQPKPPKITKI